MVTVKKKVGFLSRANDKHNGGGGVAYGRREGGRQCSIEKIEKKRELREKG